VLSLLSLRQTLIRDLARPFLRWYFLVHLKEILTLSVQYQNAIGQIFSIPFLFRTLISPWKGIADAYPANNFQIGEMMSTLALNLTARGIGAVMRIGAMVCGLTLQLLALAVTIAYLLLWFTFPLLCIAGLFALIF
jgi:hypothetical protein